MKKLFLQFIFHCFLLSTLWAQQNPLLQSFPAYQEAKGNSLFRTQALPLGPVLNSARLESVQVVPGQPSLIYAAFGSGNLWKSNNHGLSWTPIFENMPAQGIGDIALAPSNPDILYVGTGESLKKARNFTFPGTGVYKSTDGGDSWEHCGLESTWHTGEIAVHPNNPDIAMVAALGHFWSTNTERGLYRTADGGKSWDKVLYLNERTGANDVVIAPSDPDFVYASLWENNPGISGPGSGIYRSTDGGKSWDKCISGLPTEGEVGRIGLAVSHQDPKKVYALIDNLNLDKRKSAEIYQSTDGGMSWRRTHEEDLLIFPGIGWYFADIYLNPQDDDEVYGLGVGLAHSNDGGKTFGLIRGEVQHIRNSPAQTLHLDHCELWINPGNPKHLVLANDGGLYISYDKGDNWMHYNNIPAGEFYDITLDQSFPYQIYAGAQDDATVYGPAKPYMAAFEDPWKYLWIDAWSGGDGCVTQVDPTDPNTVYFSMQNRALRRRDMRTGRSKYLGPRLKDKELDAKLAYNFIAPYFLSPHDPKTIYHGGNYLLKSSDRGDNWTCISPDLSLSSFSEKKSTASGAVAESPMLPGHLYVGTDKGAFWYSKDDGDNWQERSARLPNAYIRSIAPSKHQFGRVYVAASGINYDDHKNYLFVSEEHGKNWKRLSNGLPDETANVVLEDPFFESILYAGLLRGLYISMDSGLNWQLLSPDMPAVSISDLEIQSREKELIIATHGRGIYKLDLQPIYEVYQQGYPLNKDYLFSLANRDAPQRRDTHRDIDRNSVEPFPISFWLTNPAKVQLSVKDADQVIWEKEVEGKAGLNQYLWDLEVKAEESNFPYFVRFKQYLSPGTYSMHLKTKNGTFRKSFTVR